MSLGFDELSSATALAVAREFVSSAVIDHDSERHRAAVLQFLDGHTDALHRSCLTGHLTGSALVVDPERDAFVLLHHRKLDIWVQPGGHADGEANLARAALTEATEETSIAGLVVDPVAIDIDVHEVAPPKEGPHLHLDVRFLVRAPSHSEPVRNHESNSIRWCGRTEVDDLDVDDGLRRLVRHGFARLAAMA